MKFCFLFTFLALVSCATETPSDPRDNFGIREAMLPNGNWELHLYSLRTCKEILEEKAGTPKDAEEPQGTIFTKSLKDIIYPKRTEQAEASIDPNAIPKCKQIFFEAMGPRSKALCSNGEYELYGCWGTRRDTDKETYNSNGWVYGCYLKCL